MKRLLFATAVALSAASTVPVLAADAVIFLSIGQPGSYGQLDLRGSPPPQLIYSQPRLMYRQTVARPPIYLHVPTEHAKNWRYHCRQYNACHERVYFVRNDWYEREYAPHYRDRHDNRLNARPDDRRDDRPDDRPNDRPDDRPNDRPDDRPNDR